METKGTDCKGRSQSRSQDRDPGTRGPRRRGKGMRIPAKAFDLFLLAGALALPLALPAACGDSDGAPDGSVDAGRDGSVDAGPTRQESIPDDAVKHGPADDEFPPVLQDDSFQEPVPMEGPINTAGAEDSPFVTADGRDFYFFFTPDVRVPPNEQLLDGVTGIWHSQWDGGAWSEPVRVLLSQDVALDGSVFVQGDVMWFGSIRAGNYGQVDIYTARLENGVWTDVENAGEQLNETYDVGELHLSADGQTMYCGRPGGGGKDIFVLHKTDQGWSEPETLPDTVNSADHSEDQPALSPDGTELWFTGQSRLGYPGPAVFRSIRQPDGTWGRAEEIISQFAGEPSIDPNGNVYFVHHFMDRNMNMLEADIYVARRK